MNETLVDVAVMHLEPGDMFVGFSGETYTVTSVGVFTHPMSVRVEFSHKSQPQAYASMTFGNPRQSMSVIKK